MYLCLYLYVSVCKSMSNCMYKQIHTDTCIYEHKDIYKQNSHIFDIQILPPNTR
jgi:hypothetical protein